MALTAEQMLMEALEPPLDKQAAVVQGLLFSLHAPDSNLDALRAREAEDRH